MDVGKTDERYRLYSSSRNFNSNEDQPSTHFEGRWDSDAGSQSKHLAQVGDMAPVLDEQNQGQSKTLRG